MIWNPGDTWELALLGIFVGFLYVGFGTIFVMIILAAIGIICTPFQSRLNALVASKDYRRRFGLRFLVPWAHLLPGRLQVTVRISTSSRLHTRRPVSREIGLHFLWFLGAVSLPGSFALFTLVIVVYALLDGASVHLPDNTMRAGIVIVGTLSAALIAGAFTVFTFRAWLSSVRQAIDIYKRTGSRVTYSTPSSYASPFRRAVLWTCASVAIAIVSFVLQLWAGSFNPNINMF